MGKFYCTVNSEKHNQESLEIFKPVARGALFLQSFTTEDPFLKDLVSRVDDYGISTEQIDAVEHFSHNDKL